MIPRRRFLADSTFLILEIGAMCLGNAKNAFAKSGGNGGGRGGGNGNGGGHGGGNGGGNAGGNGGGNGKGGGNNGQGSEKSSSAGRGRNNGSAVGAGAGMMVRHRNGIEEALDNGRYIMRDRRGRTIINRAATAADRSRLRALTK